MRLWVGKYSEDQGADKRSNIFTVIIISSIKRIGPKSELTGFLCDSHQVYT